MGQVNCRKHYLSLRKSLVLYVIAFVVLAVFLSVTTFSICDGAAEGISASYPPSGEKYYLTNEQGEQLGSGAYIGTVPVPMSKEDECTIALLEKLPIVATPIYSAYHLGGLIVPSNVQQLTVGSAGVHQQVYDLVDNVLVIRAEPEQKVYLQRLRKIFFQLGAFAHPIRFFRIEWISLTHFSIILFSLITS